MSAFSEALLRGKRAKLQVILATYRIEDSSQLRCGVLQIPDDYKGIDALSPFGVELRYDDLPIEIPAIDRVQAIKELEKFLLWVVGEIRSL